MRTMMKMTKFKRKISLGNLVLCDKYNFSESFLTLLTNQNPGATMQVWQGLAPRLSIRRKSSRRLTHPGGLRNRYGLSVVIAVPNGASQLNMITGRLLYSRPRIGFIQCSTVMHPSGIFLF